MRYVGNSLCLTCILMVIYIVCDQYCDFIIKGAMIEEFDDPKTHQKLQKRELTEKEIKIALKRSFETLAKVSPSSQELSKAHQDIADTMKTQFFLKVLISLLIDHQENIVHATFIKQILTTFTTYIRHQQSRTGLVKKIHPQDLNKQLILIFTDPKIEEDNRRGLLKTYPQFIFAQGMETIRHQTIDNFCEIIGLRTENIEECVKNEDFFQSQTFAYMTIYVPLAHTIIKGPLDQSLMKMVFKAFIKPLFHVSYRLLGALEESIYSKNEPFYMKISHYAERTIEFLKDLILVTSKEHFLLARGDFLRESILGQLIMKGFCLSLRPKGENIIEELVVPANGNNYLDRINGIKKYFMEIVNYFSKLILSEQDSKKRIESEDYKMPFQIIKFIINHMIPLFIKEFDQLEYPKNGIPHQGFYKNFIEGLSRIVKILKFYNESERYRNVLIFHICLPLLQRNQDKVIKSASDFKGEREDILNMHAMDIPENAVCKLIQSYIDKVDGSAFQFSNQLVNIILFHLTANPNIFQKMPEDLTDSPFFKNAPFMMQIQCCLTVLALLSYIAPGRTDLILLIEDLLSSKKQFFFKETHPGTFKSAVLLCYTYYIDNFYLAIVEGNSNNRQFHLQMLENCCVFIKQYTGIKQKSTMLKEELISLQIGALQAFDCLNNAVTQHNFFPALFWVQGEWTSDMNENVFMNIFRFLLCELSYELNTHVMDLLEEFYTQNIKNQCEKGFALKRFRYEWKGVPQIIRTDLSNFIGPELLGISNVPTVPNYKLMNAKIMNVFQLILTCCEDPASFLGERFFGLKMEQQSRWDQLGSLDIYMRRVIEFKNEGKPISKEVLQNVLQFFVVNIDEIIKLGDFKQFFGILINLIVVQESIIHQLIEPLGEMLMKLLNLEDSSQHYDEQLQTLIEKCSYILMIAINLGFNQTNAKLWADLAAFIQTHLSQRSSQGIVVFSSSSIYIGKLLTICLIFMYHMRKQNLNQAKISFLWQNTIKHESLYKSLSEKLMVSKTLINLLEERDCIAETDQECLSCFKMLSSLLYSSTIKVLEKMDIDNEGDSSDSGESQDDREGLQYQTYTISCNEYTEKDVKDSYVLAMKNLCHKLKQKSPEFIKAAVEELSLPIKTFVKQKVFYFQGNIAKEGIRKIVKVKK